MRHWLKMICSGIVLALLIVGTARAAMDIPNPPTNGGFVLDQTSTLTTEQIQTLNQKLEDSKRRTGVEIGVLLVPVIENDYIENISLKTARKWGIGGESSRGVLLLISKNDRKLRIEVGTHLEGDLTDARAARIIRDVIVPKFKTGQFYDGIDAGLQSIFFAIKSEDDPSLAAAPKRPSESNSILILSILGTYMLIMGMSWLGSLWGRSRRWWPGGIVGASLGGGIGYLIGGVTTMVISGAAAGILGALFDFMVSRNYARSIQYDTSPSWWAGGPSIGGGGIDSGDGGGFSGFGGGGDFGGGGAGGDW